MLRPSSIAQLRRLPHFGPRPTRRTPSQSNTGPTQPWRQTRKSSSSRNDHDEEAWTAGRNELTDDVNTRITSSNASSFYSQHDPKWDAKALEIGRTVLAKTMKDHARVVHAAKRLKKERQEFEQEMNTGRERLEADTMLHEAGQPESEWAGKLTYAFWGFLIGVCFVFFQVRPRESGTLDSNHVDGGFGAKITEEEHRIMGALGYDGQFMALRTALDKRYQCEHCGDMQQRE